MQIMHTIIDIMKSPSELLLRVNKENLINNPIRNIVTNINTI